MHIFDLILPKIGDANEDCEDRKAYIIDEPYGRLRAAVADGATATAFSGEWADLLVREYCDRSFTNWDDFFIRCSAAAKRWNSEIYSKERPWHSLMRSKTGAAAAIAGIELSIKESRWSASALGDSCIFQIRSGRVYVILPSYTSEQFDNHPRLVSTDIEKNVGLASAYKFASGTFKAGDRFILATDAASESIVQANQRTDGLHEWIIALAAGKESAQRFITSQRETNKIRDDDVAIIMIEI